MTNNTRRIKTFIGAMMLAAAIMAGYATFVSHALHTYFALAVLVLAAVTSRMKVKLPGQPDVPCRHDWDAVEFRPPGPSPGHSHLISGTDRSGRRNRSRERGQGGGADLVEPGAS